MLIRKFICQLYLLYHSNFIVSASSHVLIYFTLLIIIVIQFFPSACCPRSPTPNGYPIRVRYESPHWLLRCRINLFNCRWWDITQIRAFSMGWSNWGRPEILQLVPYYSPLMPSLYLCFTKHISLHSTAALDYNTLQRSERTRAAPSRSPSRPSVMIDWYSGERRPAQRWEELCRQMQNIIEIV